MLEDIHAAVAKQAPDIVGPVIDKAEQDGKITAAQADRLRDAVGEPGRRQAARRPAADARRCATPTCARCCTTPSRRSPRSGPAIAKPIIDKALADKKITEAQADQLRELMSRDKGGFPGPPAGSPPAALRAPAASAPRVRLLRAPARAPSPRRRRSPATPPEQPLLLDTRPPGPLLPAGSGPADRQRMHEESFRSSSRTDRTRPPRRQLRQGRRRPQERREALQGAARRHGRRTPSARPSPTRAASTP